jgi:hypothetical protein
MAARLVVELAVAEEGVDLLSFGVDQRQLDLVIDPDW